MTRTCTTLFLAASLLPAALAQSTMTPLATFGTNGWLAPGASAFVTTGNTERGLAYNPTTGNLVLVSRAGGNHARVLDGTTGADLGGLDTTGVAGGTFAVNMTGITDDGTIYVGNLSTSATANFKVYAWSGEATGFTTPPTVAFDAPSGVARSGDAFAVRGSFVDPHVFVVGGGTAVATGQNSNFVHGALDGTNTSTAYIAIPGTTTASNDYRLGLAFVDAGTVIGNQGGLGRITTFSGATATVTASPNLLGSSRRALDYAVIGGVPVLAVIDSVTAQVTVFDLSVPGAPLTLATANNTSGALTANANATGSVQWGAISGNTALLYALGTNHGVQAFTVTIQQPARATTFGAGCGTPALALGATGAPILPSSINLQTTNIPPAAVVGGYALGFAGIPSGVPIPIAPGCSQFVVPLATDFFLPLGNPSHQLPQNYPADPGYAGLEIFAQSFTIDGASAILSSNGLKLYLQTF
jgi:hypothetical protein